MYIIHCCMQYTVHSNVIFVNYYSRDISWYYAMNDLIFRYYRLFIYYILPLLDNAIHNMFINLVLSSHLHTGDTTIADASMNWSLSLMTSYLVYSLNQKTRPSNQNHSQSNSSTTIVLESLLWYTPYNDSTSSKYS